MSLCNVQMPGMQPSGEVPQEAPTHSGVPLKVISSVNETMPRGASDASDALPFSLSYSLISRYNLITTVELPQIAEKPASVIIAPRKQPPRPGMPGFTGVFA